MIKAILDEIAAAKGADKKKVLVLYSDNETLKRVLYAAKSNRVNFYIKKIPPYSANSVQDMDIGTALNVLGSIANRQWTGAAAVELLAQTLSSVNEDDAYVIERIIDRDLKIGLGVTNINKVIPNLIEVEPYQGAESYNKRLVDNILANDMAMSQLKADGFFANVKVEHGDITITTRSGEIVYLNGSKVRKDVMKLNMEGRVLNGEFTIQGIANRSRANGIIASISDILSKEEERGYEETQKHVDKMFKKHSAVIPEGVGFLGLLDLIEYSVWDVITVEEYHAKFSEKPAYARYLEAKDLIEAATMVNIIECRIVTCVTEAMDHFQEKLAQGLEGTILKSCDAPWRHGKKNSEVKMKLVIECDLKIVGFSYGTVGTKNEHVISTLNVESSDGIVKVSPSGMTEADMQMVTDNQEDLLNTIISMKSCGLSEDKDGNKAMMHPSVVEFRKDKTEADSYEEILAIENAAKGLENATS